MVAFVALPSGFKGASLPDNNSVPDLEEAGCCPPGEQETLF